MSARTERLAADPPSPPFEVGDFAFVDDQKYDLIWCPLCWFDPDRPNHRFRKGKSREEHFFKRHGPDDVGRPVADLVAELRDDPDHVPLPNVASKGAVERHERAKAAKTDRRQAGLDAFGGDS